jgi:hypothetical protein
MIQWEQVELDDATHVEINGEVFELKVGGKVEKSGGLSIGGFHSIDILVEMNDWANIPKDLFPILGIKCLRKVKREPIEFEGDVVIGTFHGADVTMLLAPTGIGTKYKCVEILEEEE